jgi:DNA-binding NarL/FixJ family response regulator
MEQEIKLLLVDDHSLFREGLARLLEGEIGFKLAGSFSSLNEALGAIERESIDVVLLDFDLGEQQGLQFLSASRTRGFKGKVLMVTAGMSEGDTFRALKAGASGIFLKHRSPSDLITAIHRIVAGETWLDSRPVQSVAGAESNKIEAPVTPTLLKREHDVLLGVFEGLTNKEIGSRFDISESYVKAILQQLFDKTGVRTRAQLVRVALEKKTEFGVRLDLES